MMEKVNKGLDFASGILLICAIYTFFCFISYSFDPVIQTKPDEIIRLYDDKYNVIPKENWKYKNIGHEQTIVVPLGGVIVLKRYSSIEHPSRIVLYRLVQGPAGSEYIMRIIRRPPTYSKSRKGKDYTIVDYDIPRSLVPGCDSYIYTEIEVIYSWNWLTYLFPKIYRSNMFRICTEDINKDI